MTKDQVKTLKSKITAVIKAEVKAHDKYGKTSKDVLNDIDVSANRKEDLNNYINSLEDSK